VKGRAEVAVPKRVCKDCAEGKKAKVKLECSHTVCEECISQYAATHFSNNMPYGYLAFCSACKKKEKISKAVYNV
jgi:hypothetical protein